MAELTCVPHGLNAFESLLAAAKLSEREADAVRSVVLGLTAAQAAPLIGVSASTVGSYRQRAYQKLGVSSKVEFLALAECKAWRSSLAQEPSVDDEAKIPEAVGGRPQRGMRLALLFLKCLAASFAIVTLAVVLSIVSRPR